MCLVRLFFNRYIRKTIPKHRVVAKRYAALLRWKDTADNNQTFCNWKNNNELASELTQIKLRIWHRNTKDKQMWITLRKTESGKFFVFFFWVLIENNNSDDKQKNYRNWNLEKLPTLGWKIGTDELWCFSDVSQRCITHATSDLGIWLNGKLVLYLEVLANQKNNANLVPNPRVARERWQTLWKKPQ